MFRKDVEIRVIAVNGAPLHFTLRELQSILLDGKFFVYLALAVIAYTVFDRNRFGDHLSTWIVVLIWIGVVLTYVTSLVLLGWLLGRRKPVPLPLISIVSVFICTLLTQPVLSLIENTRMFDIWAILKAFPTNYLLAQVFEVIFTLYILPNHPVILRRRFLPKQSSEISIAGELVDRLAIQHIRSEDHYIHVVTAGETKLFRARFSDVVQRLEASNGQQVHRSHWVAFDSISYYRSIRGKIFLTLKDGTEIPVSRAYAQDIRKTLINQDIVKKP